MEAYFIFRASVRYFEILPFFFKEIPTQATHKHYLVVTRADQNTSAENVLSSERHALFLRDKSTIIIAERPMHPMPTGTDLHELVGHVLLQILCS